MLKQWYLLAIALLCTACVSQSRYEDSDNKKWLDEPAYLQAQAIAQGNTTSAELVSGYLARIGELDKKTNSVLALNSNALAEAKSIDKQVSRVQYKKEDNDFKIVSKLKPTNKTLNKLIFAFNICRSVKSNAIVITKDYKTIGIGSGQPSRLDSCKIAIDKMKKFQKISDSDEILAASDAFFPFVDGIEKLVQAGISAVIQPSGSKNDKEIIKFANQTNTILVFSKTRHFNH